MGFSPAHLLAVLIFDSPMDIGIVVLIAVILFGGKKIPELMKGVGQGIREFKNGMRDDVQSPAQTTQVQPPAAPAPPATEEKK